MGIFDYVEGVEVKCPRCNKMLGGWQSKDGKCYLQNVHYTAVDRFYTHCLVCGTWVEFNYKTKPPDERTLDDYVMTVRQQEGS